MIKLKHLLSENTLDGFDNLIKVWHGGRKWNSFDAIVQTPKKNRGEAGAGIYTTTNYETAAKYAKGPNVVSLVGIQPNITLSNNTNISIEEYKEFAQRRIGPKNRKQIIEILNEANERLGGDGVPAEYLINLGVNFELPGKQKLEITKFVVSHGIDATLTTPGGFGGRNEEWLVIHNPTIIKKVVHTSPSAVTPEQYTLQSIKNQIS